MRTEKNWFGVEGATFIYYNDWEDPVVEYDGVKINYYDIESWFDAEDLDMEEATTEEMKSALDELSWAAAGEEDDEDMDENEKLVAKFYSTYLDEIGKYNEQISLVAAFENKALKSIIVNEVVPANDIDGIVDFFEAVEKLFVENGYRVKDLDEVLEIIDELNY